MANSDTTTTLDTGRIVRVGRGPSSSDCVLNVAPPFLRLPWQVVVTRLAPRFYGSYQKTAPLVIVGRVKFTESPWRTP